MVLNKDFNEDDETWELIDEQGNDGSGAENESVEGASDSQENLIVDDGGDLQLEEDEEDVACDDDETSVNNHAADETSAVSSITGDHHTVVSDVDEEDDEEEDVNARNNTDTLVDQLSQMGFEEQQVKKTISDLREAGVTDIDVDSVIGSMVGESSNINNNTEQQQQQHPTNPLELPLRSAWEFVDSTVQELNNEQNQLRHRTSQCIQNINRSAQELLSNVREESQKLGAEANVQARNASTHVKHAASTAKESIKRANEEYSIAEKVVAVAVVGGATLLAIGNPRSAGAAMAVAGASFAVGETMKQQQSSGSNRDYGLRREDGHLD